MIAGILLGLVIWATFTLITHLVIRDVRQIHYPAIILYAPIMAIFGAGFGWLIERLL